MNNSDHEALERFRQYALDSGQPVKNVAKTISSTVGQPGRPSLPADLHQCFWQLNDALASGRLNRHQIMCYVRYGEAPAGDHRAA